MAQGEAGGSRIIRLFFAMEDFCLARCVCKLGWHTARKIRHSERTRISLRRLQGKERVALAPRKTAKRLQMSMLREKNAKRLKSAAEFRKPCAELRPRSPPGFLPPQYWGLARSDPPSARSSHDVSPFPTRPADSWTMARSCRIRSSRNLRARHVTPLNRRTHKTLAPARGTCPWMPIQERQPA